MSRVGPGAHRISTLLCDCGGDQQHGECSNSTSSGLLKQRRMLSISSLAEALKGYVRDQSIAEPLKIYVGCLEAT